MSIWNSNQLLSENKIYSLNSTYNFSALKNLQFRFQEKKIEPEPGFEPRISRSLALDTEMGTLIAQLVRAPG